MEEGLHSIHSIHCVKVLVIVVASMWHERREARDARGCAFASQARESQTNGGCRTGFVHWLKRGRWEVGALEGD